MLVSTFACALAFALIHLYIRSLHVLDVVPRSRWLSFAGGVAVSYIFLHVLPELSGHQRTLENASEEAAAGFGEQAVYLVALVGLAVFYGLERSVKSARGRQRESAAQQAPSHGVFWIHIGSFAFYNLLIGYLLLHREASGFWSLVLYAVAMALHFVTTDFGLRQDHEHRYDHTGRWLLATAVLLGWLIGAGTEIPDSVVAVLFAFLAGGVILNVLKEELPEERQSRFWPFATGAASFAVLLLVPA